MTTSKDLLDWVLVRLRSAFGASMHVLQSTDERIELRIGSNEDAVLCIRIADSTRPSFAVSHPSLRIKRDGSRHVQTDVHDGVLIEGIEWIARQLDAHGVVMPELF